MYIYIYVYVYIYILLGYPDIGVKCDWEIPKMEFCSWENHHLRWMLQPWLITREYFVDF